MGLSSRYIKTLYSILCLCLLSDTFQSSNYKNKALYSYYLQKEYAASRDASFFAAKSGGDKTILQRDWIKSEIKNAKEKGISVSIEGILCDGAKLDTPSFVQEDLPYMIDFDTDSDGKIVSMNFNKISQF